jgi:hypothetical protein
VLAAQVPAERQRIEQTLAGLRFIRNRIGADCDLTAFIKPAAPGNRPDNDRITAWTWRPVPGPALPSLSPRGVAWEMTRYHAYLAQLAGDSIGKSFQRATTFLELAAAELPSITDATVQAAP